MEPHFCQVDTRENKEKDQEPDHNIVRSWYGDDNLSI